MPNVLGLAIALLLDRRGWLYNALRSVFFVPMVLSSVVVSIIWTRLLDNEGPINQGLRALGVAHPPGWLSDPDYALYSLGSIISWQRPVTVVSSPLCMSSSTSTMPPDARPPRYG